MDSPRAQQMRAVHQRSRRALDIVREAVENGRRPEFPAVTDRQVFCGELNLLTGQAAYLVGRVLQSGRIHRISPEKFRQLMANDPEVSDVLFAHLPTPARPAWRRPWVCRTGAEVRELRPLT